jgi:hypothetical protein
VVLRGAGFAVRAHLTVSFDEILCQATQPTVPELISVSVSLVVGVSPTRLRPLHHRPGPPGESRFTPQPGNTTVLTTNG